MQPPQLIIAKAGGSDESVENSLDAIHALSRITELPHGCELALEIDARVTLDEGWVAFHDATLERAAHARGAVRSHSQTHLCEVALRSGGRIPSLEAVFEARGERRLILDVHDADRPAIEALLRLLRRQSDATLRSIVVASESRLLVPAVRAALPGVCTAATKRELSRELVADRLLLPRRLPAHHPWIVPARFLGLDVATSRFVARAAQSGDPLWVFGVSSLEEVVDLAARGVVGVFTTEPRALCAGLCALQSHNLDASQRRDPAVTSSS